MNPVAWPNNVRRAENFFPNTRTYHSLLFRAPAENQYFQQSPYTVDELRKHKEVAIEPLLPDLKLTNHSLKVDCPELFAASVLERQAGKAFVYQDPDVLKYMTLVTPDLPALGVKAFEELDFIYPTPTQRYLPHQKTWDKG